MVAHLNVSRVGGAGRDECRSGVLDATLLRMIRGYVVPDALHPEITLNAQSGRELLVRQQVSS
ncbi:hypothetical protein EA557_25870, partial [Salmonella enterica subsp. enterica serovar Poona]|nr:hypothetical protein [Salmonella enterica subsp. enterica serovar Poona]